jgi:signal recognition particle subunit SRP68
MPVSLDLLFTLKETQLQHGLRAENYARYHQYLSNRVATLRRQLKLSNDKKKFLHREVTATNATDARHLVLLALYAERCWAEAESILETIANVKRQETSGGNKGNAPAGGVPPKEQYRKRLNKAVNWAQKLSEVSAAVADPRTQVEAKGYAAETVGRCALSHGRFADARDAFKLARDFYITLQPQSNESQWPIVMAKVGELDDRVVYCMECLGEDPMSYRPTQHGGVAAQFAVTVQWNRRNLNIFNVKVKDTLREVQVSEWAAVKQRALEAVQGPVPIGTQAKVLEVLDRSMGLYNDALSHARTDLRSASDSQRQEQQLLVHYLTYHVALISLERTKFLLEVFERRYRSTVDAIRATAGGVKGAKGVKDFPSSQYASPLEVIRLCDAGLETIAEMCLLPGVAGGDDVEAWEQSLKSTKLYYAAEANRVAGDRSIAATQYAKAKSILTSSTSAEGLSRRVDEGLLSLSAENALQTFQQAALPAAKFLVDALDTPTVASAVTKFPPDFQAVPCKPVFVDIAATYIDYPGTASAAPQVSGAPVSRQEGPEGGRAPEGDQAQGKKWGWGWGWGKK